MAMLRSCGGSGGHVHAVEAGSRLRSELSSPAIMFMSRGFAAPRRTKQDEQLAVRDRHVKSTDGGVLAHRS